MAKIKDIETAVERLAREESERLAREALAIKDAERLAELNKEVSTACIQNSAKNVTFFKLVATTAGVAYLDNLKKIGEGGSPPFFDFTKQGGLKATLLILNPAAKNKAAKLSNASVGFDI